MRLTAFTLCLAFVAAPLSFSRAASRVVLVGADGMTFDVVDPLIAQGHLPNLAELIEHGARGVLVSERPMRSPALWTTIATGQPRNVHQIYDFVTGSNYWPASQRGGEQTLVTSDMRRAPALWNILSAQGRSSLVVGWLNTWPAENIKGIMVAPYVALGTSKQTSIKGKIYADARGQTHPPAVFDSLRQHVVSATEINTAEVRTIIDVPPAGSPLLEAIPQLRRYAYTARWSLASGKTNVALIEHLLANSSADLVMTYFDGSDTLAHRFWLFREELPEIRARLAAHGIDPALAPELKRRFGAAVENYYQFFDQMLGRIRAAAGPDAVVIVLSDHGWTSLRQAHASYDHVPFDGKHHRDGVLIAAGPGVQKGTLPRTTLYDVAPTALYALDATIPAGLPGRVVTELFNAQRLQHAPRYANPLEAPQARNMKPQKRTHFEDEELERLRSLGYVQ